MARIVAKITFTTTLLHRDLNQGETYEEARAKALDNLRNEMRSGRFVGSGLANAAEGYQGGIELVVEQMD